TGFHSCRFIFSGKNDELTPDFIYRFHEPTAAEGYDPLRLRVLVPLAHPTHRLDDHQHGGARGALYVDPRRRGPLRNALQFECAHLAAILVADPLFIGPDVPVSHGGLVL